MFHSLTYEELMRKHSFLVKPLTLGKGIVKSPRCVKNIRGTLVRTVAREETLGTNSFDFGIVKLAELSQGWMVSHDLTKTAT